MTKLNAYLDKLEAKQLLYVASALALLADVLIIAYIYATLDSYLGKDLIMNQLVRAGYPPNSISQTDYLQFRAMLISNVKLMLNGFLVVHAIVYLCCAFAKKWAIKYVKFYAVSSAIIAAIAIYNLPKEKFSFIPVVFVLLLVSSYVCLRKFRYNKL